MIGKRQCLKGRNCYSTITITQSSNDDSKILLLYKLFVMHTSEARNLALGKHAKSCLVYDQPLSFTSQLSANQGRMQEGRKCPPVFVLPFFACFLFLFVLDGVRLEAAYSREYAGWGGRGGTNVNKNNYRRPIKDAEGVCNGLDKTILALAAQVI